MPEHSRRRPMVLTQHIGACHFESLEPRQVLAAVPTETTLVASSSETVLGESVRYVATVDPLGMSTVPLTGYVRFRDGVTLLGRVPLDTSGRAVFDVYSLFIGFHSITARFVANADFRTSTSDPVNLNIFEGDFTTSGTGLKSATIVPGTGAGTVNNQRLQVNYTGYLVDGTKFDSSLNVDRSPFSFTLGTNAVIDGWDEGMLGMKVGETRVLIVPPSLGYGSGGQGNIPGNATLYFVIRMLSFGPTTNQVLLVTGSNAEPIATGGTPSNQNGTGFGAVRSGASSQITTIIVGTGSTTNPTFPAQPAIAISGANPNQFKITQLQRDDDRRILYFTVQFNPTFAGFKRARITIVSTDTLHPTYEILLRGSAV